MQFNLEIFSGVARSRTALTCVFMALLASTHAIAGAPSEVEAAHAEIQVNSVTSPARPAGGICGGTHAEAGLLDHADCTRGHVATGKRAETFDGADKGQAASGRIPPGHAGRVPGRAVVEARLDRVGRRLHRELDVRHVTRSVRYQSGSPGRAGPRRRDPIFRHRYGAGFVRADRSPRHPEGRQARISMVTRCGGGHDRAGNRSSIPECAVLLLTQGRNGLPRLPRRIWTARYCAQDTGVPEPSYRRRVSRRRVPDRSGKCGGPYPLRRSRPWWVRLLRDLVECRRHVYPLCPDGASLHFDPSGRGHCGGLVVLQARCLWQQRHTQVSDH